MVVELSLISVLIPDMVSKQQVFDRVVAIGVAFLFIYFVRFINNLDYICTFDLFAFYQCRVHRKGKSKYERSNEKFVLVWSCKYLFNFI